jgi:UDP-N-acetylmuramate--alanine ligase
VARARPGDLVLTLGAGDVTLLGPAVLDQLSASLDDDAGPGSDSRAEDDRDDD